MSRPLTLITGANGQIGSYLARDFALQREPLLLLVHDRRERLQGLESPGRVAIRGCDLTRPDSVKAVLAEACAGLDAHPACVVHTAAVRSEDARGVADADPEVFARVFSQNLMAAFNLLQAVLPSMREYRFGRIVLFGSDVARTGLANGSAYASAKAALINLMRSAALENARHGILLNAISPAPVDTDLEQDYAGAYLKFRQAYFAAYKERSPTGKLISLKEIALITKCLLDPALENLIGREIILGQGIPVFNSI
jgi:3-oxoacyl-[acyl-carrier protein] reductase